MQTGIVIVVRTLHHAASRPRTAVDGTMTMRSVAGAVKPMKDVPTVSDRGSRRHRAMMCTAAEWSCAPQLQVFDLV